MAVDYNDNTGDGGRGDGRGELNLSRRQRGTLAAVAAAGVAMAMAAAAAMAMAAGCSKVMVSRQPAAVMAVTTIGGRDDGGSGCNAMPPKPLEGDFLFPPSFLDSQPYVGRHYLAHCSHWNKHWRS